ncbi:MAG: apolipoprotein N-acyltransferase [Candidatus Kapabacteria bacterium]|nr:apolipoprotein N-acyltransferase [Candidatus Kapabacteria bacterium]
MSTRRTYILAAISGILAGAAYCHATFPTPSELMLVAFVPLMFAFFQEPNSYDGRRAVVGPLYVCFFLFHGICNWWISSWQDKTDPYLLVSGLAVWLAHPLLLMLPWYIATRLSRRLSIPSVLVLLPFLVSSAEWIHGQTDFSYPWLTLGYSLIDLPAAQVAEMIGVYGLTFMIVLVNVFFYEALRRRQLGRPWISPVVIGVGVCAVLTLAGMHLESVSRANASVQGRIMATVVQPNIDPWDKWSAPSEQLEIHRRITDSLRGESTVGDVVVWSETAIPFVIRNYRNVYDWMRLKAWVDTSSFSLLTGFADMMVYPQGDAPASARSLAIDPRMKYDHFNAAMVVNPGDPSVSVHRKTMLTPFAERLPFADQLSFAMKWFEWGVGISAWGKGRARLPLPVISNGDTIARIGTIICIESIYPDVARDMVNNGADVLAVITNDAWYNGTWGPRQHFDIARMRAIEMRRPIIRCANSGVSGFIDATGQTSMELPELQRMAASGMVTPGNVSTFYARFGDVLPIAATLISLLALLVARIPALLRILPPSIQRQPSHNSSEV